MASSFVDSHRCNQCLFFFFFFFFFLLLLLQLGACKASLPSPATTIGRHGSSSSSRGRPRISSPAPAITALCRTTAYPQQCTRILSTLPAKAPLTRQIIAVSAYALRLTNFTYSAVVRDTTKQQRSWDQSQIRGSGHGRGDKLASGALQDCIDLMGNSMDQLHISISKISGIVIPARGKAQIRASHARVMDAQVSLSAAYTFQDTCQDEINGHHDASYAAALLIKQSGPITQTIAVGLSLAETLQHKILHP